MENKHKKILAVVLLISSLVLATVIGVLLLNNKGTGTSDVKEKKFKVTFDVDGGVSIPEMLVDPNTEIVLPTPTKEGFVFNGWQRDGELVLPKVKIDKDMTFKVIWYPKNPNTFKVVFDTNGGTPILPLYVIKGEKLYLPGPPTKEGYKFVVWKDPNGRPIYNEALLMVEDEIVLKAEWAKDDNQKYKCPDGYTLKDKKCEKTIRAQKVCQCLEGYVPSGNECIKSGKVFKKCKDYNDLGAGVLDPVNYICYYGNMPCEGEGTPQGTYENKCYKHIETGLDNINFFCAAGYKLYGNSPNNYTCSKKSLKTCKCPDGYYDIAGRGCFKTEVIDATLK